MLKLFGAQTKFGLKAEANLPWKIFDKRAILGATCPRAKKPRRIGRVIKVDLESKDYSLPLSDLHNVKLVTLPRAYPTFLPYFFDGIEPRKFDINEIESLRVSIGPGIPESGLVEQARACD